MDFASKAVIVTGLTWAGASARPEDIAAACQAVVTASYTTGQTIVVDGGLGLMI